MKLIVGLGNPGDEYQKTLHNIGFAAVDALAMKLGTTNWSSKFKGLTAKGTHSSNQFILLKPQTYMNLSGEAVVACKQFFKIEVFDTLIVSDDIDLPAGHIRYRTSGGHGGHNGLRSIIQLTGEKEFHRLRIGIGRPKYKSQVSNFLLNKPSEELDTLLEESVKRSVEYLLNFIEDVSIQVSPLITGINSTND